MFLCGGGSGTRPVYSKTTAEQKIDHIQGNETRELEFAHIGHFFILRVILDAISPASSIIERFRQFLSDAPP